ncbi:peptidase [Phyllobacterium sp. 628]|nr:peptidase [Phyllobacterium sp. 628]
MADVNEKPSAKRHEMMLNGKQMRFTAQAGHLIAYAPKDPKNPEKKDAEAGIFYTAYTRDDLPKDKRPVTFFWNGGPGSPAIWLHMGSWAPWRLVSDAPNIPGNGATPAPESFPLVDDMETLLDQSDLVFIDPPGTGYSAAIEPHTNQEFWSVDPDAKVIRDFITRYINANNRQSSPKYLYGESYGGIRTPIVANLLLQAGTSNYDPDNSGKPPVVLTGVTLQSPILDFNSDCDRASVSCAGYYPTYAMVADFHKKSEVRGTRSVAEYADDLRRFVREEAGPYTRLYADVEYKTDEYKKKWDNFVKTEKANAYFEKLASIVGFSLNYVKDNPNLAAYEVYYDLLESSNLMLGRYDGRMKARPTWSDGNFDPDDYINKPFISQFKALLQEQVNYSSAFAYDTNSTDDDYTAGEYGLDDDPIMDWKWQHLGRDDPSSLTDLVNVIIANPGIKLLVLHGYHDLATPFHQTELDLAGMGLAERVPVKVYDGGHMTYNTEASRAPMRRDLEEFYRSPSYPPVSSVSASAAIN